MLMFARFTPAVRADMLELLETAPAARVPLNRGPRGRSDVLVLPDGGTPCRYCDKPIGRCDLDYSLHTGFHPTHRECFCTPLGRR